MLDVWQVSAFQGAPQGREGQRVQWFDSVELETLDFPAANWPIVKAVRLPARLTESNASRFVEGQDYLCWDAGVSVDWTAFRVFTEAATLPVYLFTKGNAPSLETVWQHGGQGLIGGTII